MLRLQDEEWRTRDSSVKRETFDHSPDRAHDKRHLSTGSRGSFFHPHPEQALPLYSPLRYHTRMHFHSRRRPNLRNLTVGNDEETRHHDLSETVRIASASMRILASFKRDDSRIRRVIASKYGERRTARTGHLLHTTTKTIVAAAVQQRQAIVLEDIRGIRCLYRKGNGQTRKYRGRMNGWSFNEAQRQLEYKARWVGLPVLRLSRRETRGSSMTCPRCGERLQSDRRLERKLWCGRCRVVMDRDRVAAVNLARRGRVRFARFPPPLVGAQRGAAEDAVKGNPTPTAIPGVDAPKLTQPTKS